MVEDRGIDWTVRKINDAEAGGVGCCSHIRTDVERLVKKHGLFSLSNSLPVFKDTNLGSLWMDLTEVRLVVGRTVEKLLQ